MALALLGAGMFFSCAPKEESAENKDGKDQKTEAKAEKKKVVYDQNDASSMLAAVTEAVGGMDKLKSLHDVSYRYEYLKPDNTIDISEERYIFDNEVSWARYSIHEVNVMPGMEGEVVQFYNGNEAMCCHKGEMLEDEQAVVLSKFLRKANYFWFTMMFKLTDPGTIAEVQGQEEVDGTLYDVVSLSYKPEETGKEANDAYILYINPQTHLVDQFMFSLPFMGVNERVLMAKVTYEEIDGVKVPAKRMMYGPNPETGEMALMVDQTLSNIKFNNGFTAEELSKDI